MENASKALIIAGAIILGILIIGLGMAVFNQAREAMAGTNLDSEKAQAFNSKFMEYTGANVTGTQVKNLIDLVISNNNTISTTENLKITLDGTNDVKVLAKKRNNVKNATKYKVTVEGYTNGYITTITVNPTIPNT